MMNERDECDERRRRGGEEEHRMINRVAGNPVSQSRIDKIFRFGFYLKLAK